MKYRVVGWTEYDDVSVDTAPCSESALQAIIKDIAEGGYIFSGWDHQESMNGAPVLNDGKKRLFSQRGFGGVMARAHGDFSRMGYARYAFSWHGHGETVMPKSDKAFCPALFTPETDLNEEIRLSVPASILAEAEETGAVRLEDRDALTFLDIGDTLTLLAEGKSASYLIEDMDRKKDLSEEEEFEIFSSTYSHDPDVKKQADEKYESAKWVIEAKLKRL